MPVRITRDWRPALQAIARLQNENAYPKWEFFWANYSRTQRKAVRRMRRDLLSNLARREMRKRAGGWDEFSRGGPRVSDDFMPEPMLRPVPVLTPAQEAFHSGITPEAFSLEKAVQLYSNQVKPEDEQARMEARDNVSNEELIARMQAAPDMCGSLLVELSEFVHNQEKK